MITPSLITSQSVEISDFQNSSASALFYEPVMLISPKLCCATFHENKILKKETNKKKEKSNENQMKQQQYTACFPFFNVSIVSLLLGAGIFPRFMKMEIYY